MRLSKDKKYLVAVSGGPDSMALLDMLVNKSLNLVVAHVNYKKRLSSDRDENIVKVYCKNHKIKCYVNVVKEHCDENFQKWARDYRYSFFETVYKKEHCDALLIAHQKDDYLETYLSKKDRNSSGRNVAISPEIALFNMQVYRPILFKYYKDELISYCEKNKINYGIDETNNMPIYSRNKLRMKLNKMNKSEKEQFIKKALLEQEKLDNIQKKVDEFIKQSDKVISVSKLLKLNKEYQTLILFNYINNKLNKTISQKRLEDLISKLKTNKNFKNSLDDEYELVRSYDELKIESKKHNDGFLYIVKNNKEIVTPYFKVSKNGPKMCGIHVDAKDYPLTIRSFLPGDTIKINEGTKKVSRLFIDKKIPLESRKSYPLVVTNKNEVVLISTIYQDIRRKTLQSNIFVIK